MVVVAAAVPLMVLVGALLVLDRVVVETEPLLVVFQDLPPKALMEEVAVEEEMVLVVVQGEEMG
jgi:hypothetical protein